MAGDPSNPGIVPRSLDVLFNSIRDHQQMECTFRPDGANGFTIRSGPEACAARHELRVSGATGSGSVATTPILGPRTPFGQKKMENMMRREWESRKKEMDYVDLDEKDHGYSVFVTYIEIYENYVYDLLDDSVTQANQPPSKPIRTDKNGSAFVQGLKEVEVSHQDEALRLFLEGNRRRRQASHKMNKESSRSHAIFNLRLVQAIRDSGLEILTHDNNPPIISQLSLVDLAGSENAKKTDAIKKTLKEAGNINNSLDALKRLIKTLRDNQRNGKSAKFDYRTEKLTHLFRTNFEGDGKIRIIICINPAREYFSDTERVLAFASQSQEVMINRALDAFRHKVALFTSDPTFGALQFAPIGGAPFGPPLPSSNFLDPNDEKAIPEWIEALEARKQARDEGLFKLNDTFGFFRSKLAKIESGSLLIEQQLKQKETELKAREMQAIQAEQEVNLQRSEMESYRRKVASLEKLVQERDDKIHSLQLALREKDEERERLKMKYQEHVRSEQKRIKVHYERQLIEVVSKFQNENLDYKERMRLLNEIITSDPNCFAMVRENYLASRSTNSPPPTHVNGVPSSSGSSVPKQGATTPSPSKKKRTNRPIPGSDDILERGRRSRHRSSPILPMDTETNGFTREDQHPPSFNPRHKRSLSAGNGNWIDHRPPGTLDLGTIFQPKIKNKTSLSNLKDASAKTFKRASNYALTHHIADPVNGEVETQVIKGDVIPSLGGGAHVIFNDVETLKQSDPCSPSATHRLEPFFDILIHSVMMLQLDSRTC